MAKSKRSPKCMSKQSKRSKKSSKRSKMSKSSKGSPSKHVAYCLGCGKKVKMLGCKIVKSVKGQPMKQGKCSMCGRKISQFVKKGTKNC